MQIVGVSLKSCASGSCWQISSGYISCSKWCPIVGGPPQHSIIRVLETSRTLWFCVKHQQFTEEIGWTHLGKLIGTANINVAEWRLEMKGVPAWVPHSAPQWRAPGSQLFLWDWLAWAGWCPVPGQGLTPGRGLSSVRRFSAELDSPATGWALGASVQQESWD